MPQYKYKCPQGHITTAFSRIVDYVKTVRCDECTGIAERFIDAAPMGFVQPNYEAYHCPITNTLIDGRAAHEANLKKHGCRVYEPGETEGLKARKAKEEAAFDKAVEATAEEFVEKLPTAKREQLGRELESGVDVSITRN